MGPAGGVAFSLLVGFAFAGPALPLSVLFALLASVLIANSIGQLAKQMPSAGGLYTYASTALGPKVGFLVGWSFLLIELLIPTIAALVIGTSVEGVFRDNLGITTPWWIWAVITIAIIFALNYFGVRISTNAGMVLGIFEIIVILALALYMIFAAGAANTLAVFNPSSALEGSWSGVFKGMIFVILAFQGFEAAAPLGEEARSPRKTIPRAVVYSAVLVGLFYLLCAYASVMGWGFDKMASYAKDPDPWHTLATTFWGVGWVLIFLAVTNSVLAAGNAGAAASTRTLFSMGRTNILPSLFGRTHPSRHTPHVAIVAQATASLGVVLLVGLTWGTSNSLGIIFTLVTLLIILVYMALNVGTTVFYLRERREEFNFFLHGVFPAIAFLVLCAPLCYQFNPLPDYPIRWGTWFALICVLLGVAIVAFASVKAPMTLEAARAAFTEDSDPQRNVATATPESSQ
jgi:amino acid transporter